jgi:hypothetical protein
MTTFNDKMFDRQLSWYEKRSSHINEKYKDSLRNINYSKVYTPANRFHQGSRCRTPLESVTDSKEHFNRPEYK